MCGFSEMRMRECSKKAAGAAGVQCERRMNGTKMIFGR